MQRGQRKRWAPASLVSSIEAGATVAEAAQRHGVTRRTVARFAAAHPEFRAELDRARDAREAMVRETLEWIRATTQQVLRARDPGSLVLAPMPDRARRSAR